MRKALANDGDQTLFERAIFSFNFASGDERTEVYFTFHSVIIWDNTGMIAFPRNAVMMMLRMRHSLKPSGWRLNIFLFSPCLAYKCAHSQSTCSGLYLCTKHIFPTLMLKVNVTHSFYLPPSLSLCLTLLTVCFWAIEHSSTMNTTSCPLLLLFFGRKVFLFVHWAQVWCHSIHATCLKPSTSKHLYGCL